MGNNIAELFDKMINALNQSGLGVFGFQGILSHHG